MADSSIRRLLEGKRFIEALYFGTIALAVESYAELHLHLGLACCAVIQPLADLERSMRTDHASTEPAGYGNARCLYVSRDTLMVNEGLQHLLRATLLQSDVRFPATLTPVSVEVLQDMHEYVHQEFHGFRTAGIPYSMRTAAWAAMLLLCQLQNPELALSEFLSESQIKAAQKLILNLASPEHYQAAFYAALDRQTEGK